MILYQLIMFSRERHLKTYLHTFQPPTLPTNPPRKQLSHTSTYTYPKKKHQWGSPERGEHQNEII